MEEQTHYAKKSNSGLWLLLLLIVLLSAAMYFFIFGWIVPKTAALTVPQKWRMIPVREPKTTVHDYLGEPVAEKNADAWFSGTSDKKYVLHIYYWQDTVAAGYSIHYRFENRFAKRDYLIDSFSIR